jgi:TRAP-type mannitol/chloroaromatic compound transport system permease small subunit
MIWKNGLRVIVFLLVGVTFFQVLFRYVALHFVEICQSLGFVWLAQKITVLRNVVNPIVLQELEWHLFSLLFLFGATYAWVHNAHVRVDILYERFSERTKALVSIGGFFAFCVPFCIWGIFSSYDFWWMSFTYWESSPNSNGLPWLFVIKGTLCVGFVLLLWCGGKLALKSYFSLRKNRRDTLSDKGH